MVNLSTHSDTPAPDSFPPAQSSSVPQVQAAPLPATERSAETLAAIDAGGYISPTDKKVDDYQHMLDALLAKYGGSFEQSISDEERERRIGNVLAVTYKALDKKGIKESLLNIGWQIDEQFDNDVAKQLGLAQAAAVYVVDKTGNR